MPSIAEVERIASLADPAIRNLQITHCYHMLAMGMTVRTGRRANWCTFATWASRQAGQTIRNEDLARTLEDTLGAEMELQQAAQALAAAAQRLGAKAGVEQVMQAIWKALDPQAAFVRSSEAVARGNLKVFAEIGREFARFYAACLDDPAFEVEKIDRFCQELRPGEPPDGQGMLQRAFRHYYQALFTEDEKEQAELLLLANIEIGFHEQTRLQPEINEALVAPIISPQEFAGNLIHALRPQGGWLSELLLLILRLFGQMEAFDDAIERIVAGAQRQAQALITDSMMTIDLPGPSRLRLGDDLSAGFPLLLKQIAHPELQALLREIDPTPDSTRQSGAEYWGDLHDRLHFIADLFRCYELQEDLFEAPFSAEQTAAFMEGRLPEGPL